MKKRLLVAIACSALLLSGCEFIPDFNTDIVTSQASSVDVEKMPNKTQYEVNEDVDLTGLTLKVSYEDHTTKLVSYISNENTISLVPLSNNKSYTSSEGEQNVTVKYQDPGYQARYTSYKISVGDVTPTPIDPIIKCTISFDANGGKGTMESISVNKGTAYTLPPCGFNAPSGKQFKNWQINYQNYSAGDSYTVMIDTTIKAIWEDVPTEQAAWTIMIYLCGNDLESGKTNGQYNGLATEDINEILSVKNQPNDVNIIIQTGGAKHWSTSGIPTDRVGRYYIQNKQLKKDPTDSSLTNVSMGASSTFQDFLEWGLKNYPAEKTGVILWNHGGALEGVCYDENNYIGSGQNRREDRLTDDEVVSALSGAFKKVGRTEKLEFIGYDACLMQVQDIAEFNSTYFNYMIGSQESEAGEGWEYDTWIDDLYAKKPTETILKAICDGFVDSYERTYGSQYDNDQTQSYLDLSKVAAYKTAFETLASQIAAKNNVNALKDMLKDVKCYADTYCDEEDYEEYVYEYGYPESWFDEITDGKDTYYLLHGYHLYGTFDVYDFLTKLSSNNTFKSLASTASNVKSALSQLVKYNKVGDEAGESHGLCLVCPMNNYTDYLSEHTHFSTWRNLVY